MRYGIRQACVLALTLALTLGVAACGGSNDDGDSTAGTTAAEDLSGTVTVWDIDYKSIPGHTEAVDQLAAEFEKDHPDVTIKHVAQPLENYEQVYQAAFTAREGPDVMLNLPGALGVLRWSKGLEPLDNVFGPEIFEELKGWDQCAAGFSADGEPFGMPVGYTGQVFYYNKKMFAKAGLPTDFQPETWDEVREAGEKLKAAGIQPFTGGNKEGYENSWWSRVGWESVSTSQEAIELGEGKIPYTDEIVAKAFEPEIMMEEAGLYPDDRFSVPLFPDGAASFGEEKGAMFLGLWAGGAYWGEYVPTLGEKNFGIFFTPGSNFLEAVAEYCYAIPSFAEDKEAAAAFLEFLGSRRGFEVFGEKAGTLPNRGDVSLPADAPVQAEELVAKTRETEAEVGVTLTIPSSVGLGPLLTGVNEVLQGRQSLESAQEEMQEASEKTTE